jgi:hypothetical protein
VEGDILASGRANCGYLDSSPGDVLARRHRMVWEVVLGRALAMCAHPAAAWRVRRGRAVVLGAYFTAGYVSVLLMLLVI